MTKLGERRKARRAAKKTSQRPVSSSLDNTKQDNSNEQDNSNKFVGDINMRKKAENNENVMDNFKYKKLTSSSSVKPQLMKEDEDIEMHIPESKKAVMKEYTEAFETKQVRSQLGKRNADTEVTNAWRDYQNNPEFDPFNYGLKVGDLTYKRNAEGNLMYTSDIDLSGTGSIPRPFSELSDKERQDVSYAKQKEMAKGFQDTPAGVKHKRQSGESYSFSPFRNKMEYHTDDARKMPLKRKSDAGYYGDTD
jgi:hypothetical protein